MFLASISSSFLSFQFNCSFWHCKCNCFSCCLWYYVVSSGGKLWRFRTSCCDCSSTTTLSSSLPFFMFSGFLETVNSPSFVWRFVALSFRQYCGFTPSGSRQLPIARSDGDQCPVTLRNWRIVCRLYTRSADREILTVIGYFATSKWWAIKSSIPLYTAWHCVLYNGYNAYFLKHVWFEFKDKE